MDHPANLAGHVGAVASRARRFRDVTEGAEKDGAVIIAVYAPVFIDWHVLPRCVFSISCSVGG